MTKKASNSISLDPAALRARRDEVTKQLSYARVLESQLTDKLNSMLSELGYSEMPTEEELSQALATATADRQAALDSLQSLEAECSEWQQRCVDAGLGSVLRIQDSGTAKSSELDDY